VLWALQARTATHGLFGLSGLCPALLKACDGRRRPLPVGLGRSSAPSTRVSRELELLVQGRGVHIGSWCCPCQPGWSHARAIRKGSQPVSHASSCREDGLPSFGCVESLSEHAGHAVNRGTARVDSVRLSQACQRFLGLACSAVAQACMDQCPVRASRGPGPGQSFDRGQGRSWRKLAHALAGRVSRAKRGRLAEFWWAAVPCFCTPGTACLCAWRARRHEMAPDVRILQLCTCTLLVTCFVQIRLAGWQGVHSA